MTKKMTAAFAAFALALTGSCGGDGGLMGAQGNVDAKTMTALLAGGSPVNFNQLLQSMEFDGTTAIQMPVSLPTGVGFASLQFAGIFDGCTTKTGSATDADGDGVAKGLKQVFNCSGISHPPGTMSLTGTYEEIDGDDAKPSIEGGWSFTYDFSSTYDAPHEYNDTVWSGGYSAKVSGKRTTMISQYKISNKQLQRQPPGPPTDFVLQSDWSTIYDAVDASQPWTAGTMTWDGYFGLTGKVSVASTLYEVAVVWQVKSKITYDRAACPGGFYKDGYMQFIDGGGGVFEYKYVNCNVTKFFNGKAI